MPFKTKKYLTAGLTAITTIIGETILVGASESE